MKIFKNKIFLSVIAAMLVGVLTIPAGIMLSQRIKGDGEKETDNKPPQIAVGDIKDDENVSAPTGNHDLSYKDLVDEIKKENNEEKKEEDKAKPSAKPITPIKRPDEDNTSSGGITIGGNSQPVYDCKTENHSCDGPETHAYILNLELAGCKYCSSHSCPSFYATDEWGNTCYTPEKCPQYDKKSDAVYYCQKCGRENGNGDNNTCQKWIVDFVCPICKESVPKNECHTHG